LGFFADGDRVEPENLLFMRIKKGKELLFKMTPVVPRRLTRDSVDINLGTGLEHPGSGRP
jgi:hypothetical protein